jgi:subtilisin family serine protease
MKHFCLLGTIAKVTMQLIASLLVAILLTANFAYAQVPGGSKGKASLQLLEKMDAGTSQNFIVVYDDSATQKEAQTLELEMGLASHYSSIIEHKAARYAEKKQEIQSAFGSHEATVLKDYSHLPLSFVHFHSREALDKLLAHPGVMGVYENTVMRLALAESLPLIGQPQVAAQGNLGAGTYVAVLDTGVDYTLPAFGSCTSPGVPASCKVVFAHDFAPSDGQLDDNGHGTNVAGIVLGVAPGTKILALDVFKGSEGASSTDIVAAINWVIDNKPTHNIVAMNLSLGSGKYMSPVTGDPYYVAVQGARAAGVLTIAAAGNDGYTDALSQPAATSGVVSVGAVYDSPMGPMYWGNPLRCQDITTAADKVTCFSNSASFLTLLAPGSQILAAGETEGGTSQAAPHVAGAVALLRAAFPSETLDQTVARLTNGEMVTDSKNGITKPRLNLQMAIGVVTSCVYAISETSKSFGSNSSTGSIAVTTGAGCTWSAASSTSSASWLTVTSGNSGSGNGTVSYALQENPNTSSRTGTLTVAGKTYTVTQSGSVGAVANILHNSGFESGPVSWTEQTANGYPVITAYLNPTTTNNWYAWLCGYNNCVDILYQDVTIPADAQGAILKFYYWIETFETSSATAFDSM